MDLQYIPGHTHSSDSGCLRSMWHGRHKHQGMGLGTCCLYMQDGWHILGWLCTHVCTLHRGRLAARANMCKMLHHSFPCTRHLYHKGWVCMGQWFLVGEWWLKIICKKSLLHILRSYLLASYTDWKDPQWSLDYKYKLAHGFWHCSRHWCRTVRDKGPGTCGWCTPCQRDSRN